MGFWSLILLNVSLILMTTTGELLGKENEEPWDWAERRVLVPKDPSERRPCISWQCKRDMLLQKNTFLNFLRGGGSTDKKSSVYGAEEEPCISWECRRKRREVSGAPQQDRPKPGPEDIPCLTRDCRTGKRSTLEDSGLKEKLRFARSVPAEPQNQLSCLAWFCQHGKRQAEDGANKFQ